MLKEVSNFTDFYDFGYKEVWDFVNLTHIYNKDGIKSSHYIYEDKLASIIDMIDFGEKPIIFDLGNDDYDLYFPSNLVSLIEIPRGLVKPELMKQYENSMEELDEN